jgi:nucleoside-diphosphate-sugar epimerase
VRAFVTGGGGFIGQALVRRLAAAGHEVEALHRRAGSAPAIAGVDWVEGDLGRDDGLERAAAALGRADVVVHAAAVRRDWELDDRALERVNVASGPRLMALAGRARRFLFVSSVAVYGHPVGGPAREDSPFAPSKRYGASKVAAERALVAARRPEGLGLTVVRPGIVYGPGDTYGMVANMARLLHRRRFLLVGPGTNRVNLLHVDDLARALLLALTAAAAADQDFILAGPEAVPMRHLAETLATAVSSRLPRLRVPAGPARLLAGWMEASWRSLGLRREPFLTRAKVDLLTSEDLYDASRARERLGFEPAITLAEGVGPTVDWLRRAGEL